MQCTYEGCGWHAIAPSERVAREQLAEHVVEAHATEIEVEIPEGMVQVRTDDDDEWRLMTLEEATKLHDETHEN